MYDYRFLSHTADIAVLLQADSLKELFAAGLHAMNEVLREGFCRQASPPDVEETLTLQSIDDTALLIDFLSEALTLSYLRRCLFCEVEIGRMAGGALEATLRGCPVDFFTDDIKAVTYHDAHIRQTAEGRWETPVIFDI
jgi:SHS2 domain-containing protein